MPVCSTIFNMESDNAFQLQSGSNNSFDEGINEIAESFVAFIQGRYVEASTILTGLIDRYEQDCPLGSAILSRLYYLQSECESRFEHLKSAYKNGSKPIQMDEDSGNALIPRRSGASSVSLKDNIEMEIIVEEKKWNITASQSAQNTINPIRRIVDQCKLVSNPDKIMISLSIGDPTTYGNMLPPVEAIQAVIEAFSTPTSHGYLPSFGADEARSAVAKSLSGGGFVLDSMDIILTNGCSDALEMCINCVANANDNILLPQPGFSLYVTLCSSLNIEPQFYKLKPDQDWEVDLDDMEAAINEKTKAVVINNPSNPCGAVYNVEHLQKIVDLCEKYRLPIIVDEIYAHMVFSGNSFCYMGWLSKSVPVLSCGGLGKRYICPGWRLGWIAIYDRNNVLKESIRPGLLNLSTRILGPNSVLQTALPSILRNTPQKYFDNIMTKIQVNATVCCQILARAPGLKPTMPQGTMYMLVRID